MEIIPTALRGGARAPRPRSLRGSRCKATHSGEYLGVKGWLVADKRPAWRSFLDVILARHGIANSTVYNLEPRQIVGGVRGDI